MSNVPPTARTNRRLVIGILDTPNMSADYSPYILSANTLTTGVCLPGVTNPQVHYTDGYVGSNMELIERWLSAHFYCIFDPRSSFNQGPDFISDTIESKIDLGLKVTRYGQQALLMDYGGYLAAMENAQQTVQTKLPGAGIPITASYLGRRPRYPYFPYYGGYGWGPYGG